MDTSAPPRTAAKRAVTVLFAVLSGWLASAGLGTAAALADNCPVTADNCLAGTESFESSAGLPTGWKFVEWAPGTSTATIAIGAAADGTHFLHIVSPKPNHARVVVPMPVNPNRSYRFHVLAKARGANANMAAVAGMDGQYTVTNSVRTDTQWQPLDLYIKVGSQTTISLTMGLGHYGQLNVGSADFDAVTLTQVQAIPSGATTIDLTAAAQPTTAADSKTIWIFVGILLVAGIGTAVFLMRRDDANSTPEADTTSKADTKPSASAKADQAPPAESHAELSPQREPGNKT